jgi:high-affinity nickel permease
MTSMLISGHLAPLGIILLGLILGMRHATDTDHVIAVTTIVSAEKRMSAATRIGIAWGLGHSLTVFLVGSAIIVFKLTISPRLSMGMEFAVAVVLILLGFSTLARSSSIFRRLLGLKANDLLAHMHPHEHHGVSHLHPHAHVRGDEHRHENHLQPVEKRVQRFASGSDERAFGVGLIHGLAGSAAIALLVLSAIPSPILGLAYLAIFGLGTIIGMAIITTAIGLPMALTAARLGNLNRTLLVGAGLLSLGFGLFLAYQIGIVDGLFRSGAISNWTPS